MLTNDWVNSFWTKIEEKMLNVAPQVSTHFPYSTNEEGQYVEYRVDYGASWWTNGFWAGIMWLMYLETKEDSFKKIAIECEELLDGAFLDFKDLHHDVGFMWLPSAVAHYRIDGEEISKNRGLHAATLLAGRFNISGNFIRAWNSDKVGWGIIDCMMNIPLLYWASEVEKDPRFRQIAMAHADTVMNFFVRPDGSVNHIVVFDPDTGEVRETLQGQGYATGSSWSRGQAWALYGFILSYVHTNEKKYLDTAKKVANYFIANIPEDGVPVVDFRSPSEPILKDTTAGAIAACGLIEIAKNVDTYEKDMYMGAAEKLLLGLEKNCDFTLQTQAILKNGTERYHDNKGFHVPIIYGDYYLVEAILKLKGNEVLFW